MSASDHRQGWPWRLSQELDPWQRRSQPVRVVTFDFSSLANASATGGLFHIRVNTFEAKFLPAPTSVSSKPPGKKSKPNCRSNAKRSKEKRRDPALRRYAKHKEQKAQRSAAQTTHPAEHSPFASTRCSSGTWGFQARITYTDGASERPSALRRLTTSPAREGRGV
jgi:hypothetical protein